MKRILYLFSILKANYYYSNVHPAKRLGQMYGATRFVATPLTANRLRLLLSDALTSSLVLSSAYRTFVLFCQTTATATSTMV